eukprot:1258213-Amphidinium_carterae.1
MNAKVHSILKYLALPDEAKGGHLCRSFGRMHVDCNPGDGQAAAPKGANAASSNPGDGQAAAPKGATAASSQAAAKGAHAASNHSLVFVCHTQ